MMEKKFRRRHVAAAATIFSLIAVIALSLNLRAPIGNCGSPSAIAAMLSLRIGCPVSIGALQTTAFGRLRLQNVAITMPEELKSNQEIAMIPEALISFSPWKALLQKDSIGSIELREPRITLTKPLIEWLSRKRGNSTIPPLTVKSGSLHLSLTDGGKEWSFHDIKGRFTSGKDWQEASLTGTREKESWKLHGRLFRGGEKEFRITVRDFDLSGMERLTGEKIPLSGTVHMNLRARREEPDIKGTLEGRSIDVDALSFTGLKAAFRIGGKKLIMESIEGKVFKGSFRAHGEADIEGPSFSPSSLKCRGQFVMEKPVIPGFITCTSIKGIYGAENGRLMLKDTLIEAKEGTILLDGWAGKKALDFSVKAHNLTFPESQDLSMAPGGTLRGRLTGEGKKKEFRGTLVIPAITVAERHVEGLELSGTVAMTPPCFSFEQMEVKLGTEHFRVQGLITEKVVNSRDFVISGIPLSLSGLFYDGARILDRGTFSARGSLEKDRFSAELSTGKGSLMLPERGALDFAGITLSMTRDRGLPLSFKGTIERADPIEFSGTSEKDLCLLAVTGRKVALQGFAVDRGALKIRRRGKDLEGAFSAEKLTLAALKEEKIEKVDASFKGAEIINCSGKCTWRGAACTLSGSWAKQNLTIKGRAADFPFKALMPGSTMIPEGRGVMTVMMRQQGEKSTCDLTITTPKNSTSKEAALDARISMKENMVNITSLNLQKGGQALSLSGTMGLKDRKMAIRGTLKEQSLAELAALVPGFPPAYRGILSGTVAVEGTPEAPCFTFRGTGRDLVMNGTACAGGALSISQDRKELSGSFVPESADSLFSSLIGTEGAFRKAMTRGWKSFSLSFRRKEGKPLSLKGTGEHQALGKVAMAGDVEGQDMALDITPQQLSMEGISFTEPLIHLIVKDRNIKGTIKSKTAATKDITVLMPLFDFEQKDGMTFSGTCTVYDSPASITGEMKDDVLQISAAMHSFPLKKADFLKLKEGDLAGTADLSIKTRGREGLTFTAHSTSAEWKGKKLPRIHAAGEKEKNTITLSALSVYLDEKPTVFSGSISPDSDTLKMKGNIDGLGITRLIDLVGGRAADIEGSLAGVMAVEGTVSKPDFRFDGRILNLVYQGKSLGDGKLDLSGNRDAIKGKLDLDNRPRYNAGLPIASMEMSYYFLIEGTPQKISIRPQTADTRLKIDPGSIWRLFRPSR